jgi:hypothetical protein
MSVKRRGMAAAAIVTAMLLGAATPASAASSGDQPLALLSAQPSVLIAQRTTWTRLRWLAGSAVCDFRMTATGAGLAVAYPSNTATYSSFYRTDALARLRFDHADLQLTAATAGTATLRLHVSYVQPPAGYREGDACVGRAVDRDLTIPLGVLAPRR